MRIVMLGWEFPPFISGGLGTACFGLTKSLNRIAVDVLFLLPKAIDTPQVRIYSRPTARLATRGRRGTPGSLRIESLPNVTFRIVPATVPDPYRSTGSDRATHAAQGAELAHHVPGATEPAPSLLRQFRQPFIRILGTGAEGGYEGDLIEKLRIYTERCLELTRDEEFAVVHAHDWITFPAAAAIAARSNRPLIVHVHSTEFDRSGEYVNQAVYDIERRGMHAAARIIAVSHLTRNIILERYGVPPEKVDVVHNGIDWAGAERLRVPRLPHDQKIVLFMGRITMQKGPEFFVRAAARVLEKMDNVKFLVAGWGDLAPRMVEWVASLGLGGKVLFTGFLRGPAVEWAFRAADVYVMPSVSEPFGLTALEAIRYGTPVIISKSSGAAEVLERGAIKVDFWDVDALADRIVDVLRSPMMADSLRRQGAGEVRRMTWDRAARRCLHIYQEAVEGHRRNAGADSVGLDEEPADPPAAPGAGAAGRLPWVVGAP